MVIKIKIAVDFTWWNRKWVEYYRLCERDQCAECCVLDGL